MLGLTTIKGNRGFSLVEVILYGVLFGGAVIGLNGVLSISAEGMKYMNLKGHAEDMRNTLRIEMNCQSTVTEMGATCNGVTTAGVSYVKLLRWNGSTLIPKYQMTASGSGPLELRASCRDAGGTFQFSVEAKRSSAQKISRGIAKTLFAGWEDLFMGVPLVCAKNATPQPPSPAPQPPSPLDVSLASGYCLKRNINQFCPAGYAAFGFTDPTKSHTAKKIDTWSYCCRVPSDLLTNDHTLVNTTCPPSSVVTGGTTSKGEGVVTCEAAGADCKMRCTQINTARYKLGPELKGDFWTDPSCPCVTGGGGARWRDRSSLPLAMRFGSGRQSLTVEGPEQYLQSYDLSICAPSEMIQTGGVMVKKLTKQCGDMYGVQILYNGAIQGDPVNVPVQLLPRCSGSAQRVTQGVERYSNFICQ